MTMRAILPDLDTLNAAALRTLILSQHEQILPQREERQARARPLLDSLHAWLESCFTRLSRKSDTTAAVKYALGLWEALVR
jgi:hypothetical protein